MPASPDSSPTEPVAGAGRPRGITYYDRTIVAGQTGGGKSVMINYLAGGFRCQELLYDTKDEFTVAGVDSVQDARQIDWNQRLIHLIDDRGELEDTNRLFKIAWSRKAGRSHHNYGLLVVVHEVGDLCADQPGKTPQWFSNYVRKGRGHRLGLIAGMQRPRNIPRIVRTESQTVVSMARGCDPEDAPIMAALHNMTTREYEYALGQARALGEHAYIWGDRVNKINVVRPPLPETLVARSRAFAQGIGPESSRAPEPPEGAPESSGDELHSSDR